MGIRGSLATMSVSDLLQFLETGRKTGTLRIARQTVRKHIYYEDGLIIGLNSNDPKEFLGQFLLHYGKIDEGQLRAAMELQQRCSLRLGEILIKQNLMSEQEVLEMLNLRALETIYDLFLWDKAEFEFTDGDTLPKEFIRISIRPTAVIMEGVYRIDEWRRIREVIPSDQIVLALAPGRNPSEIQSAIPTAKLLWFLKKKMSVGEICYNLHAVPFHVYAQLFELVEKGILTVTHKAAESLPRPPNVAYLDPAIPTLLKQARNRLQDKNYGEALDLLRQVLDIRPSDAEAQAALSQAEREYADHLFRSAVPPHSVPKILVPLESIPSDQIGPKEGFILSRINGTWDVKSILAVSPFKEVESLQIIKSLRDAALIEL
ncbi:MAG: DUF4388 domain-containing protein [Acidobacteriota bacterium]